jgi:hypothetical protein
VLFCLIQFIKTTGKEYEISPYLETEVKLNLTQEERTYLQTNTQVLSEQMQLVDETMV